MPSSSANPYPICLVQGLQAEFLGDLPTSFSQISADSRALLPGALFVAISGERFDGHAFLNMAESKGCGAALVEASRVDELRAQGITCPLIAVPDTLRAFGEIARQHRLSMPAKIIAVGGSNGKTTTKELIAAILSLEGETLRTKANHNNQIGLPQTLLRLRPEHRFAVVELGTNQLGEMALLTRYAHPDVGVLTNIQQEHLDGLGSIEGVLEEETQLYLKMPPAATRVVPLHEVALRAHPALLSGPKITLSISEEPADARLLRRSSAGELGQDLVLSLGGEALSFRLGLLGAHNATNALIAATCAHALGISTATISRGLESVRPVRGRMTPLQIEGRFVIDDSYNANPGSMEAALSSLSSILPGKPWVALLGDMREMGAESPRVHDQLGRFAASQECLAGLYLFGDEAQMGLKGARLTAPSLTLGGGSDPALAAAFAATHAPLGSGVLIKGSRGIRMERILSLLEEAFKAGGE